MGRELEREDEGATERGQKYEEENEKGKRRKSGVKDKSKEISGREEERSSERDGKRKKLGVERERDRGRGD